MDGAGRTATGVVLQILATFLAALAYIWQKQAHLYHSPHDPTPATRTLRWRAGFGLMVLVALVDIYCFSLLDQSVLGAFGAVTLAWNIVLARVLLHEAITRVMLGAVLLISMGTILAVSAAGESKSFTFAEIVALSDRAAVYAWLCLNLCAIAAAGLAVERAARAAAAAAGGEPVEPRLFSVLSPVTGGMCMGLTGYGAKAISTAIFTSDWGAWARPPIWGYLFLSAGALTLQVRYLNKGLEFCDAVRVVPVFQASIILANSLGGIIFYEDLMDAPSGRKTQYAFGALLAVGGVCMLLLRDKEAGAGGRGGGHEALDAADDTGFRALAGAAEAASAAERQSREGAFANGAQPATESPLLRRSEAPGAQKSPRLGFVPWPES
jgi:hypothetical protein